MTTTPKSPPIKQVSKSPGKKTIIYIILLVVMAVVTFHRPSLTANNHKTSTTITTTFDQHLLTPFNESKTTDTTFNTPSIFHQILPPNHTKYDAWIQSWEAISFDHRFVYGDDDLEPVIQALQSKKILQGWMQMARKIEQIDFSRYAILYVYGGVYADADQELVDANQFQTLMDWNQVVLPFEKGGVWNNLQVGQALMISPPRHQFWWDLMEYIVDQYNSTCNVLQNTGPYAMTNYWNDHGQSEHTNVRLTRYLDGLVDPTQFNRSVTIHHMGGSWINVDDHRKQLEACRHRTTWTCKQCDEISDQYSH